MKLYKNYLKNHCQQDSLFIDRKGAAVITVQHLLVIDLK